MSSAGPFRAVLTERRDGGAGLTLVALRPEPDRARDYRSPGQYVEVRASASGYFVLASEVGAPAWELLVRTNGGASDALVSAPEGTAFDVVGPLGAGFPLERAEGRPLVVAVAGSALAVTRPILRARIAQSEARSTSVYIGVRTAVDVALAHEVEGWVHAGARVVLCLSRGEGEIGEGSPDTASPPSVTARRARGYVQNVLANDVVEGLVEDGGLVFAAGPAGMLEDLRAFPRAHASKLEVITNV